ncbi:MAG: hypothetical protein CVV02_02460 [Firmicutes bacterium HGW-Firmicutes-7]|nr:MAG: hypothetical protein CVV02_02460 [Firmicutes bacterium HGW-Firmicutes-7]
MKKLLALFIIFGLVLVLNGCARDLNDDTVPEGTPNDNSLIPNGTDNNTQNLSNTNTPMGGTNLTPYTTSLQELDGTLRSSVTDLDGMKVDTNDKDYLTKQSDYYSKRADAYRTALNGVNRLSYTGNNRQDHDAIVSYYQNGYDTYNKLSNQYRRFTTIDDERSYRNGIGRNAYDLAPDVSDTYERALRSVGIKY